MSAIHTTFGGIIHSCTAESFYLHQHACTIRSGALKADCGNVSAVLHVAVSYWIECILQCSYHDPPGRLAFHACLAESALANGVILGAACTRQRDLPTPCGKTGQHHCSITTPLAHCNKHAVTSVTDLNQSSYLVQRAPNKAQSWLLARSRLNLEVLRACSLSSSRGCCMQSCLLRMLGCMHHGIHHQAHCTQQTQPQHQVLCNCSSIIAKAWR